MHLIVVIINTFAPPLAQKMCSPARLQPSSSFLHLHLTNYASFSVFALHLRAVALSVQASCCLQKE